MSSPQFNLLSLLAANVQPAKQHYDGFELRYWRIVFRPAEFKVEGYLLLALTAYIALYALGLATNKSKANTWFQAHRHIYSAEFSKPTSASGDLVQDSGDALYNFSTGRRGVESLHTVFNLQPRHDIFMRIFNFGWSLVDFQFRPADTVELDFTLAPDANVPNFVFGVVDKDDIKEVVSGRYDLTFAKTTDFPNNVQYSVLSEAADVSEQFLKASNQAVNLTTLLSDASRSKYFRSFVVSDLPLEAPDVPDVRLTEQPKHVVLTLELPPSSAAAHTAELVRTAFALVDYITSHKFTLRPETKNKLRKSRLDTEAFIAKEFKKEDIDAAEKKRSEKRKAEEERIAKLSAAEQKKHEEKERKKNMRKAQQKGSARVRMG